MRERSGFSSRFCPTAFTLSSPTVWFIEKLLIEPSLLLYTTTETLCGPSFRRSEPMSMEGPFADGTYMPSTYHS